MSSNPWSFHVIAQWPQWTKTFKPWDYDKPFHRINSPNYDSKIDTDPSYIPAPIPGNGFDCGCRDPKVDYQMSALEIVLSLGLHILGVIPTLIIEQLVRTAPSWVPVGRKWIGKSSYDPSFQEKEQEVEGVLWRSFQTWTDVPLYEWHRWYDWNFHVLPMPGFAYMRSQASTSPPDDNGAWQPVGHSQTMELEWDTGAFGSWYKSRPGGMFDENTSNPFDKSCDWAWPQAGQYLWAAGRHIYDCGHATEAGLMRAELHPLKAIASARWEAFKFDQNQKYVPAIQFLFFANRFGGYWDFETIKPGGYNNRVQGSQDYEFIVDLPQIDGIVPFHIGHSPDFDLNTIVLRPQLLIHYDSDAFRQARGSVAPHTEAIPVITLLPNQDPSKAPEQAKVKIPLSQLANSRDAYGVIISMGWHDPSGAQAAKVKKVTVTLDHIQTGSVVHDRFSYEEWEIKIGINGRWAYRQNPDNTIDFHSDISLENKQLVLYLADRDYLFVSMHGNDRNRVGDYMAKQEDERRLDPSSGDDTKHFWTTRVDQPDNSISSQTARSVTGTLLGTLNQQNEPIGLVDANQEKVVGDSDNPWQVRNMRLNSEVTAQLTGVHTKEDGDSGELVYNLTETDYILYYRVKAEPQP